MAYTALYSPPELFLLICTYTHVVYYTIHGKHTILGVCHVHTASVSIGRGTFVMCFIGLHITYRVVVKHEMHTTNLLRLNSEIVMVVASQPFKSNV